MLALFLGGLSLGYALFGHVTRTVVSRAAARGRPPPLLLLYGGVEAGIGLHALCFPWLFLGAQRLSLAIPVEAGGTGFLLGNTGAVARRTRRGDLICCGAERPAAPL